MNNEFNFLKQNGYIHIKSVLNIEEVNSIRESLEKTFQKYNSNKIKRLLMPSEILSEEYLYTLPFKEKIISSLRKILGNYYMIPDFQVQRNMFGTGPTNGWHVDSNSERAAWYLHNNNYRFLKCGIYLQDNTYEWGGGINILPGGHKFPIKTYVRKIDHKIKQWLNRINIKKNSITVPITAGDFVAFDSRLPHASTFPNNIHPNDIQNTCCVANIPTKNKKYVIYWNSTNSIEFANEFMLHAQKRAKNEELTLPNENELYFTDFLRFKYPNSYSDAFVNLAKNNRVSIASLPSEKDIFTWQVEYEKYTKSLM